MREQPIRKPESDGVYPRCVWCGGENYALNVLPYSVGESACHICGKMLPQEYVKLENPAPNDYEEKIDG